MTAQPELAGQVVVVTGGSRGIGRAIVEAALERGARVAFCYHGAGGEAAEVLSAAERSGHGDSLLAVRADVTSEEDVDRLFDTVTDTFGRVDAVVNNAAVNSDNLLIHTEAQTFDHIVSINLTGAFLVSRRAVHEFLAQGGGGRIVSMSSVAENGATSQVAYAASKGGLHGLTRTIAKEYGRRGIGANVVVVGLVEAGMSLAMRPSYREVMLGNPLRRAGGVGEIVDVVLFLSSERASFVTGECVYASGGIVEANV